MANEAVFVAIGIACVVAVLLFIVFIIYCVKKQQDKEQTRQMRERRAREERHRRHLLRSHVVQPPPYDPNRQNILSIDPMPNSPPPEYKEIATPLSRNRDVAGIGNMNYPPPAYAGRGNDADHIPTVSRNVAPANTVFTGNNYFIGHPAAAAVYGYNTNYNNRNDYANAYNSNVNDNQRFPANHHRVNNDNSLQVRPTSGAATTVIVASSSDPANGRGPELIRPYNNRQTIAGARPERRGAANMAVFQVQTNERASFDPLNVTNSTERVPHNSTNPREVSNPTYSNTLPREARRRSCVIPTNRSDDLRQVNLSTTNHNDDRNSHRPVNYELTSGTLRASGLENSHEGRHVHLRNSNGHGVNRRTSNQRIAIAHPTAGVDDLSLI